MRVAAGTSEGLTNATKGELRDDHGTTVGTLSIIAADEFDAIARLDQLPRTPNNDLRVRSGSSISERRQGKPINIQTDGFNNNTNSFEGRKDTSNSQGSMRSRNRTIQWC